MFTLAQIKAAHAKVRSGADFPAYIRDIKQLGVSYYETFVADGSTSYYGAGDYKASAPARYGAIDIAGECNVPSFLAALQAHQQGKTDFPTFVTMSAAMGILKWTVSTEAMTCTYHDKSGRQILVEKIPEVI